MSPSLRPLALLAVLPASAWAQKVSFDRPGYRLHSIGQRIQTSVRVTDDNGRAIRPTGLVFRVQDPGVAAVNSRGEVVSRKAGLTRVWAIAGRDSASAFVTVEQRAARFAFNPAVLRLDALSATVKLQVQLSDSAGVPIPGNATAASSCRTLDDAVVSFGENGDVVAKANGATWIRCTDRGFADSLRVEVRQRAQRVTIPGASKNLTRSVGDTFTVPFSARDRQQKALVDVRPTWVSLDPKVVAINPTTGRAEARTVGPTRIIVQIGDAADTANVNIQAPFGGGLLQAPAPAVDSGPKATGSARTTRIDITPMNLFEGETKRLVFTIRDAADSVIRDPKGVSISFSDTSTLAQTDTGLLARKPGSLFVVVRYNNIRDSALVTVRSLEEKAAANTAAGVGDNVALNIPVYAPGLAQKYAAERDSALRSITTSEAFAPATGRTVTGGLFAGLAAHSSNQVSPGSTVIEDRTGVIYGGRATVTPFAWLAMGGDLRLGSLNSTDVIGEPMTITEANLDGMLYLVPWLGIGGGYTLRANKTEVAIQRWTIPRGTIASRLTFVGDAISSVLSFSVLPGASLTGFNQKADIGFGGEGGVEIHRGSLDAAVLYYVERLSFPEISGTSRVDQVSSLRFRVGFKLGR